MTTIFNLVIKKKTKNIPHYEYDDDNCTDTK